MKKTLPFLAALAILLAGCASKQEMKTRLILQDDYAKDHLEVNIEEFTDARGMLGVQATIRNTDDKRAEFQYRFRWFTEDGQFIDSPTATWVPVYLEPQDTHIAQSTQVTKYTTRPRLSIRRLD